MSLLGISNSFSKKNPASLREEDDKYLSSKNIQTTKISSQVFNFFTRSKTPKKLTPSVFQINQEKLLTKISGKKLEKIKNLMDLQLEFRKEYTHQYQVFDKIKKLKIEYLEYSNYSDLDLTRELFLVSCRIKTLSVVLKHTSLLINHLDLIHYDNKINKRNKLFNQILVLTTELEKVYDLNETIEMFMIQNQNNVKIPNTYAKSNSIIEKIEQACLSWNLKKSELNVIKKYEHKKEILNQKKRQSSYRFKKILRFL